MSSLQKALVEQKKSSLQSALAKEMIANGGGGNRRKNPPTVSTAYESSSEDEEDSSSSSSDSDSDEHQHPQQRQRQQQQQHPPMKSEDMLKIRQQAVRLVNTPSAGPHAEAAKKRHPQAFVSPYQNSTTQSYQNQSLNHTNTSQQQPPFGQAAQLPASLNPFGGMMHSMHDPLAHPPARTAEPLSVKDMVVNCVSEVCKSSSSEIVARTRSTSEMIGRAISSGYKSVNNYENPPVSGNWGEIDTSQHGYGNNNNHHNQAASNSRVGNLPARYQD